MIIIPVPHDVATRWFRDRFPMIRDDYVVVESDLYVKAVPGVMSLLVHIKSHNTALVRAMTIWPNDDVVDELLGFATREQADAVASAVLVRDRTKNDMSAIREWSTFSQELRTKMPIPAWSTEVL